MNTPKKAKYIGKHVDTSFGQYIVELEYEYRGKRYTVYENRNKGNIPLSWQHKNEQGRIDTLIEMENNPCVHTESAQVGLDKLFNYFETGEWED